MTAREGGGATLRIYRLADRQDSDRPYTVALLVAVFEILYWWRVSQPDVLAPYASSRTAHGFFTVVLVGCVLLWLLRVFTVTKAGRVASYTLVLGVALANGVAPVVGDLLSQELLHRGSLDMGLCVHHLRGAAAGMAVLALLVYRDGRHSAQLMATRCDKAPLPERGDRYWRLWLRMAGSMFHADAYMGFLSRHDPCFWVDVLGLLNSHGHFRAALLLFRHGLSLHGDSPGSAKALEAAEQAASALGGEQERQQLLQWVGERHRGRLVAQAALRRQSDAAQSDIVRSWTTS